MIFEETMTELEKAKNAVRWLLDHPNGLVDMHGLKYWAGCVESLRKEVLKAL